MASFTPLSNHLSSQSKMWTSASSKKCRKYLGLSTIWFWSQGNPLGWGVRCPQIFKSSRLFFKLQRLPWPGWLRTYTDVSTDCLVDFHKSRLLLAIIKNATLRPFIVAFFRPGSCVHLLIPSMLIGETGMTHWLPRNRKKTPESETTSHSTTWLSSSRLRHSYCLCCAGGVSSLFN